MNLAGKTWGGTDQAYKALITKPTATSSVASGYALQDGEGTNIGLYVGPNGVGPLNGGGFSSPIGTLATANRTVYVSDASGRLSAELIAVLGADVTNDTTSPSAVSSFGVTLEASAIYEFQITLRVRSASATTGVRTQVTGPTGQLDWACYECEFMTGTALATPAINRETLTSLATVTQAGAVPASNTDCLIHYRGLLKTTSSTPASDIGISFQSETPSTTVTIRSGSLIRFRKIN